MNTFDDLKCKPNNGRTVIPLEVNHRQNPHVVVALLDFFRLDMDRQHTSERNKNN